MWCEAKIIIIPDVRYDWPLDMPATSLKKKKKKYFFSTQLNPERGSVRVKLRAQNVMSCFWNSAFIHYAGMNSDVCWMLEYIMTEISSPDEYQVYLMHQSDHHLPGAAPDSPTAAQTRPKDIQDG